MDAVASVEAEAPVRGPRVHFPVRLRLAASADLNPAALEPALVAAFRRAFARARSSLPAQAAVGDLVLLQPPTLAGGLPQQTAAMLLKTVQRAARRAAVAADLPLHLPPARPVALAQERFDPARFDPSHATYDVPSYRGGRRRVRVRSAARPFARVLRAYDAFDAALSALRAGQAAATSEASAARAEVVGGLWVFQQLARRERHAVAWVASALAGQTAATAGPPFGLGDLVARVRAFYTVPGHAFPAYARLRERQRELERGVIYLRLIRVQAGELDRLATAAGLSTPLGQAYLELGTSYLKLPWRRPDAVAHILPFLQTFYAEPGRVAAYAVLLYVRRILPDTWKRVREAEADVWNAPVVLARGLPTEPEASGVERWAMERPGDDWRRLVARAVQLAADLHRAVHDVLGDSATLPQRPEDLHAVPGPAAAAQVAADIARLQVDAMLLAFWKAGDGLLILANSNLGPYSDPDWERRVRVLQREWLAEEAQADHTGLELRRQAWQNELKALQSAIVSAVRRARVEKAVVEAIPVVIASVAAAEVAGALVETWISENAWVIAVARGGTMTAVNLALAPSGVRRPTGAIGWGVQLITNILFARLMPVLSALDENGVGWLAESRLAFLRPYAGIAARGGATAALTVVQSAATALIARTHRDHGESSFSEILTINLILNGIALLVGEALRQRAGSNALVLRDPDALARTARIPEDAAREWLALEARSAKLVSRLAVLKRVAEWGMVSDADLEDWRREGLDLANDLERDLPGLAEALDTGHTPAEIRTLVARLRGLLRAVQLRKGLFLPPGEVRGLMRVAGSTTWVYAEGRRPPRMAALERSFRAQGYTVTDLPRGGGVQVNDPTGAVVFLALPAPAPVRRLLPPSLEEVARGRRARAGLRIVLAQRSVPELPADLAALAGSRGRTAARLLRLLALLKPGDTAAWSGLARYLRAGADPALLARALTSRTDPAFAAGQVRLVLGSAAGWDNQAIAGLAKLYTVRPRTTSAELADFLTTFNARLAGDVLATVDDLAGRSLHLGRVLGPLLRTGGLANRGDQQGALGVLLAARQLAADHPQAYLDFERKVSAGPGIVRRYDVTLVSRQSGAPLAHYEVKEVSTASLGSARVRRELAVDILLDATARAGSASPPPPLDSVNWLVRGAELRKRAMAALGVSDPDDPRVDAQMRRMVQAQLEPALADPILRSLTAAQRRAYAAKLRGVPFVTFF